MKKTINFSKNNDKYIFEKDDKSIEIDVHEKTLSGNDLYNTFFKDFEKGDEIDLIDKTTDEEKSNDKMCLAIYNKMKDLFSTIENGMNTEITVGENDSSSMNNK